MSDSHANKVAVLFKIRECHKKSSFLISQPKHMLWVLKRTVSTRLMDKEMDKTIFTILRSKYLSRPMHWCSPH